MDLLLCEAFKMVVVGFDLRKSLETGCPGFWVGGVIDLKADYVPLYRSNTALHCHDRGTWFLFSFLLHGQASQVVTSPNN